jgi:hypothetical protein
LHLYQEASKLFTNSTPLVNLECSRWVHAGIRQHLQVKFVGGIRSNGLLCQVATAGTSGLQGDAMLT